MITELIIWQCEFSVEGAESIAKILEKSKTLKALVIHGNHIGDAGITTISKALPKSNVCELHVNHCGFSFEGAKSLAEILASDNNSGITCIKMWGNPITLKGARLLALLITPNRKIEIDQEYWKDPDVSRLMQNMEINGHRTTHQTCNF